MLLDTATFSSLFFYYNVYYLCLVHPYGEVQPIFPLGTRALVFLLWGLTQTQTYGFIPKGKSDGRRKNEKKNYYIFIAYFNDVILVKNRM